METLIQFAYTGSISWDNQENLIDLIKDADFLGLDDVKEEGFRILAEDLNPLKAVDAYNLSNICSSDLLKEKSQKTILQNFEIVSKTDDFLKLSIDSVEDILLSDPLIECTEKIFEGVLRWIVKTLEVRKSHLTELFGLIQVGYADSDMVIRIATQYT